MQLTVWYHIQVALWYIERLDCVQGLSEYSLQVEPSPVTFQLLYRLLPFEGIPSGLTGREELESCISLRASSPIPEPPEIQRDYITLIWIEVESESGPSYTNFLGTKGKSPNKRESLRVDMQGTRAILHILCAYKLQKAACRYDRRRCICHVTGGRDKVQTYVDLTGMHGDKVRSNTHISQVHQ